MSPRIFVLQLAVIVAAMPAFGESVTAPAVKSGDTWTYKITNEKGPNGWNQTHDETTVTRVTPSTIYYTVKTSGSTQPPKELFSGLDWSRVRDISGKEIIVNQPLLFPMTLGKTWSVDYTEPHPSKTFRTEDRTTKFTVVGYETVEVPAGKYNALKIEAEGRWTAELEPTQSVVQGAQTSADGTSMVTQVQRIQQKSVTGRTYKAFWYVPQVKRWVKSVEEYYTSGGTRDERYTGELESFKAGE